MINVALTIDVHAMDRPEDIRYCNSWLRNHEIPATFFIPTALLENDALADCFEELNDGFHEIGTHAHFHSDHEKYCLQHGDAKDLNFLRESQRRFIHFFGTEPKSFRSPTWCKVNQSALAILHDLGYDVDASATPQRLGIFSPYPKQNPWLKTPRRPFYIHADMLEIPTTCFVFPLGSPTFHTFRNWGSRSFIKALIKEAQWCKIPTLNIMLHADDFVPHGPSVAKHPKRLRDLWPRTPGGILAKYWIRETDRMKISQTTYNIIQDLMQFPFSTLKQLYTKLHNGQP